MRPILCVVHIPKTAGVALRSALMAALPGKVFWHDFPGMPKHLTELTDADFERYEVIGGHIPKAFYDERIKRPKVYVALFREPISRVISLYEYIVHGWDTSHPWRNQLRLWGLRKSLSCHPGFNWQATEEQCRFVGGTKKAEDAIASLQKDRWIYGPYEKVDQVAKEIASEFGWKLPPLKQENVGRPDYFSDYADPTTIAIIRAMNYQDAILHDYVSRRESVLA